MSESDDETMLDAAHASAAPANAAPNADFFQTLEPLVAMRERTDAKGVALAPRLFDLVARGAHKELGTELANGADPNARNESGWTVLMQAVASSRYTCTKLLVEHGARVNDADADGWTALMVACAECGRKHLSIVRVLLANCADADVVSAGGDTAFKLVAECEKTPHRDSVRRLLRDTAAPTRPFDPSSACSNWGALALYHASAADRLPVVELLCSELVADSIEQCDALGRTPLFMACKFASFGVVRVLIEAGAFVNARDLHGRTALMCASERGCEAVVTRLLAEGADPIAESLAGSTPISLAEFMKHATVLAILKDPKWLKALYG
jgi:ankyrin repeat protein